MSAATLPDSTRLGAVHVTVSDLARSVAFYQDALGLRRQDGENGGAAMGAGGEDLVVLHEEPGARSAGRHAGLYHYALLFPRREALAHAVRRLAVTRTPLTGASDHGVSEAFYLRDPDGIGIELYADRPRPQWPAPDQPGARVGMYTIALDVEDLLAGVEGEPPERHAAPGLVMGHVHLHVNDLATAGAFHRDVIGFEHMVSLAGSADFLAAGGYHHHLAINVWNGTGIPPAPPPGSGVAGIRHWTVRLEDAAAVDAVRQRAESAGSAAADHTGGFVVRDPAGVAVAVVAS